MNRKAAIELSTTFVVGLILGVVLFSLGLVLLFQFISGANKIKDQVFPDYLEIEEENCIQRGERVCVPEIKKEIKSAKSDFFWLILNNVYGEEKDFTIYLDYSTGLLKEGGNPPVQDAQEWSKPEFPVFSLENNEHERVGIPIFVPRGTQAGTYVFNVNVCFDSDSNVHEKCTEDFPSLYGLTHKITIIVP